MILSHPLASETLESAIADVPALTQHHVTPASTGYILFVFPFQRPARYFYSASDVENGWLRVHVAHHDESPEVELEAVTINREPTTEVRAHANELLYQIETRLRNSPD